MSPPPGQDDHSGARGRGSRSTWFEGMVVDEEDPSTDEVRESLTPMLVDRYEEGEVFGVGGQAKVRRVFDRHTARWVALKELKGARKPMAEVRFLREARVAARLEHPNSVPVYEVGRRPDGRAYYTMRLVRGRSLAEVIEATSTLAERLRLLEAFVDLCHALAYAHSRGIVHRDVKPSNVMVGEFGETVVLDWGLAKVKGEADLHQDQLLSELEQLSSTSTVAGVALGTPAYMSPEQAWGHVEEMDESSDTWSLGAVLYELLTGSPPFHGATAWATVEKARRETASPVLQLEPEAPPELAAIADKALCRDKSQRYASAEDLARDVSAWLTGERVSSYDYSPWELLWRFARRHKALVTGAAVAIGAIVVALVLVSSALHRERQAHDAETEARAAAEAATALAEEQERQASFWLAQAHVREATEQREERDLAAAMLHALASLRANPASTEADWQAREDAVTLRADARGEVFLLDHEPLLKLLVGGSTREAAFAAVGPSGEVAAVDLSGALYRWSKDWRPTPSRQAHEGRATAVAFTQDGRVVTAGHDGRVLVWGPGGIQELDTLGGALRSLAVSSELIAAGDEEGQVWRWSPRDGRPLGSIRLGTDHLTALDLDGSSWILAGGRDGRAVLAGPSGRVLQTWTLSEMVLATAMEEGGSRVAMASGSTVYVADRGSGEVLHQHDAGSMVLGLDWSPEGLLAAVTGQGRLLIWEGERLVLSQRVHGNQASRVAFHGADRVLTSGYDGQVRVWTLSLHRHAPALHHEAEVAWVSPSPDGQLLATATWEGTVHLWSASGQPVRSWVAHDAAITRVEWTVDGHLVTASFDGTARVWSLEGQRLHELVGHDKSVWSLAVSPRGDRLATGSRDGTVRLWTPEGREVAVLADHAKVVYGLAFSPDGELLASAGADQAVRLWSASTGAARGVLQGHSDWVSGLAFRENGHLISTGKDALVLEWDPISGEVQHNLRGHGGWVNTASLATDGGWLATAGDDGAVVLWSQDGSPELRLPLGEPVAQARFLPDGRLAVVQGFSVRLLTVAPGQNVDASMRLGQAEQASGLVLDGFELR